MKLLLDMNVLPALADRLRADGHEAEHWSTRGDPRASDSAIMEFALKNGFVVVTHDLDFSALLAEGAIVTIDEAGHRVRALPLKR